MKFSNLYEEVQKLSDFVRISHEAVVHPKSELHHYAGYSFKPIILEK